MERMRLRSATAAVLALATWLTGCARPVHGSSDPAELNEPVRDGRLVFTVTQVDVGAPMVGDEHPQGVFVLVRLTVENVGDDAENVYCQYQRLKDLAGKSYDDAMNAVVRHDLTNVDPGSQVDVTCAFDVPPGTLPAAVEVHELPFSKGATVRVLGTV